MRYNFVPIIVKIINTYSNNNLERTDVNGTYIYIKPK